MTSVLADFAEAGPDGIFFPLFEVEGSPLRRAGAGLRRPGRGDPHFGRGTSRVRVPRHAASRRGSTSPDRSRPSARTSTPLPARAPGKCSTPSPRRTASLRGHHTGRTPTTRRRCCSGPSSRSPWTRGASCTSTARGCARRSLRRRDSRGLVGELSCDEFGGLRYRTHQHLPPHGHRHHRSREIAGGLPVRPLSRFFPGAFPIRHLQERNKEAQNGQNRPGRTAQPSRGRAGEEEAGSGMKKILRPYG